MARKLGTLDEQLYDAALYGEAHEVRSLLRYGASPTARHGLNDSTALHAAAAGDHAEVVQLLLLDERVSIDEPDGYGCTAMHLACKCGSYQVFALLLAQGAALDCVDGGRLTPLHWACNHSHSILADALLEAGAPLHIQSTDGHTLLHYACARGLDTLLDKLLTHGAHLAMKDMKGWTPLHTASYHGREQMVQRLLKSRRVQALVSAPAGDGSTPLHLATREGHTQVTQLLVTSGANIHARDQDGATPMYAAVAGKHTLVVKVLLAAGADPGAAIQGRQTGLHVAARHGCLDILQQLLAAMAAGQSSSSSSSSSASCSSVDQEAGGMTALHLALEQQHIDAAKALLAAGASADKVYGAGAVDTKGCSIAGATLLHRALDLNCTAAVPLLSTPSNLHTLWRGQTPLHLALIQGKAEAVEVLVAAGALAGPLDAKKTTAIALVTSSSDPAIRALLPTMVRSGCEAYKQMLLEKGQQGAGQQQQRGKPVDPEPVLSGVALTVFQLLVKSPAAGPESFAEQGAACFSIALEVLGVAGASKLVRLVVDNCKEATDSSYTLKVVQAVHAGWLAAAPVMQLRLRNMQRVQVMMVYCQPLQQQVGRAAPWVPARAASTQQSWGTPAMLRAQAMVAAGAGAWQLFVQSLEALTVQAPATANALLDSVMERQGEGWFDRVVGLCEALLGAWFAAPPKAALLAPSVAEAVVSVVQAWRQQQGLAEGG